MSRRTDKIFDKRDFENWSVGKTVYWCINELSRERPMSIVLGGMTYLKLVDYIARETQWPIHARDWAKMSPELHLTTAIGSVLIELDCDLPEWSIECRGS